MKSLHREGFAASDIWRPSDYASDQARSTIQWEVVGGPSTLWVLTLPNEPHDSDALIAAVTSNPTQVSILIYTPSGPHHRSNISTKRIHTFWSWGVNSALLVPPKSRNRKISIYTASKSIFQTKSPFIHPGRVSPVQDSGWFYK